MPVLLFALPVLALLVLAAHFYRMGAFGWTTAAVALLALLFVRRPWAARVVQVGLLLGAIEWLRILATLVAQRLSAGAPYLRLAAILGVVALVTALAALVFGHPRVRARFGLEAPDPSPAGEARRE